MTSMFRRSAHVSALLALLIGGAFAGACGNAFTLGGSGGSAGSTGSSGCSEPRLECDGVCIDPLTDPEHCGGCDQPCEASSACTDGVCDVPLCPEGFEDCDGNSDNGCEADLRIDLKHCGSCNHACFTTCNAGMCNDPVSIAAGVQYTCAVLLDGGVWCWGHNANGNLGDGTKTDRRTPVRVSSLPGPAAEVAAGKDSTFTHTCAALKDGKVACWGSGNSGQLGSGSTADSLTPLVVQDLTDARRIALGGSHSCAVTQANSLFCWGLGNYAQIGDGDTNNESTPVKVLDNAVEIGAGLEHTCARMVNGTVQCWGRNLSGQLGLGTTQPALKPTELANLSNVTRLALGPLHTCAVTVDGNVLCWGEGSNYRLGTGSVTDQLQPHTLEVVEDIALIAAGDRHSGAVNANGDVFAWGDNTVGQLGDGTSSPDPTQKPKETGLTDVAVMSLGKDHGCAITTSREILCWGDNIYGQLGDGTANGHSAPAKVMWPQE